MKNTFVFAGVLLCAAAALPTASAGALRGANARSLWSVIPHTVQCNPDQWNRMKKNAADINALKPAIKTIHRMIAKEVTRGRFKHTSAGHFCANRVWGVTTQADSLEQCAEWTKHNEKCGTGFSYAGPSFKHCDCSPKGQTCTLGNDANFDVYELLPTRYVKLAEQTNFRASETHSDLNRQVDFTFSKTNKGHLCANRQCSGPGCATSINVGSVKECATFVHGNEKCGTGFDYAPHYGWCDCAPKGQVCTTKQYEHFDVYEIATLPAMRPITRSTTDKDALIGECEAKCNSDARCESFVVEVGTVTSTCSFRKVTMPAWLAEAEAIQNLVPVYHMLRERHAFGEFTEAIVGNGTRAAKVMVQQHAAFATSTLYADEGEPNKEYLSTLHRYAEALELQFNTTHDELFGNPCFKAAQDMRKDAAHLRHGLQWLYHHAACPVIKKAVHWVVKDAKQYAKEEIDEMCGEMAVEFAAACEVVGMGPEDPLADTCVAVFGYMGEKCAEEGNELAAKYMDIGANEFIKMVDCA